MDLFPISFIDFPNWMIATILTIIGISLGTLIYKLSFSKKLPSDYGTKEYMTLSVEIISIALLISIYISYIFLENNLEKAITFVFTTMGAPVFFLMIPIISIFSILKKEFKAFLFSSLNLLSFYLFLIIAEGLTDETKKFTLRNSNELVIFFILFLLFVEMGLKILDFDSILKRITQNRTYTNISILNGFNKLLNKYIMFLAIFVLISYIFTLFVIRTEFLYKTLDIGLEIGSIQSIILFTVLAILIPLFFWFHGPKEKNNPFKFFKNIKKKVKKEKAQKIN